MTISLDTTTSASVGTLPRGLVEEIRESAPGPASSRWLVPAAFILFAALMAITSTGFLEADEVTHFLKARSIWYQWTNLVDIWGRLGCTGLFGLVAPLGVVATRLLAVGVTTLTCIGAASLMRHFLTAEPDAPLPRHSWVRRHAIAFTWLLLFAQPCFAMNSFTVMTEMLLACPWIWTAVVLVRSRDSATRGVVLAGAILGLGGLMRPEGWIAIALWPLFAFLWLRRPIANRPALSRGRFSRLLALSVFLAGTPSLLWYLLGAWGLADGLWVLHAWPWSVASQYGRTGPIFLGAALISMAIWMWVPIFVGVWSFCRPSPRRTWQGDGRMVLVAPFLGLFLVHGLLGSLGLFGSMSLPRYFISVAPMAAILAVLGLIEIERTIMGRGLMRWPFRAAVVAIPLATLAGLASLKCLPMWETAEMRRMDVVVHEIQQRIPPEQYTRRLIVGHPYGILALGLPLGTPVDACTREAIAQAPVGTWLVTDSMMWFYENRPNPEQLRAWGYRIDEAVAAKVDAATMETEPWAIHWPPGRVRLWIREDVGKSKSTKE